ncbi:MAG: hypothetical protein H6573_00025 [Lewinellaceae bacterium]|nr:hypothetical protein [Lewinellaceae bacterium]MCB9345882.1 hypothetical protein [Lewinellaceae bacterium]
MQDVVHRTLTLQRWQKLEAQIRRGTGKREDLATDLNVIHQSVVGLINTTTEAEAAAYEYFGQNLPLLWQYPEKAYFANSVFSIHARLEEMMAYLKYKQS